MAETEFKIDDPVTLFGRPVGVSLTGKWQANGTSEGLFGMIALEPLDFCRIAAAWRFEPSAPEPLLFTRVSDPADPRDDTGVLERHFERPLVEILSAICGQLHDAFVRAARLRDERMPVREMPAPVWVH